IPMLSLITLNHSIECIPNDNTIILVSQIINLNDDYKTILVIRFFTIVWIDYFCSNYLLRSIAKITIGINIKDRIPPPSDNISKLYPATTIPDIAPPVAPPNAINTSTVPCVFARVEGSVESTIRAVPLIKPKFQPKPSKISARFIKNNELPGANAAITPAASNVIPEAIDMASRPILSTRIPVKGEGRYIAAI